MELNWTKSALEDIGAIKEYYTDKISAEILAQIVLEILNTGRKIKLSPQIGRIIDKGELRKFSVTNYSYILTYKVKGSAVYILQVFDTRRKPLKFSK